jgi:hypothetical protein
MLEWLDRWQQRQRELQNDADADLVRDNRRRWKYSLALFVCSFSLIGIQVAVNLPGPWHTFAVTLTMVFLVGGLLLGHWARPEGSFLNRPNPEEPPRLWK